MGSVIRLNPSKDCRSKGTNKLNYRINDKEKMCSQLTYLMRLGRKFSTYVSLYP